MSDTDHPLSKDESRVLCDDLIERISADTRARHALLELMHVPPFRKHVLGTGGARDVDVCKASSLSRRRLIEFMLDDRWACELIARLRPGLAETATDLPRVGPKRLAALQEEHGAVDAMWIVIASGQDIKHELFDKMLRDAGDEFEATGPDADGAGDETETEDEPAPTETPDASNDPEAELRTLRIAHKKLRRERDRMASQISSQSGTINELKQELDDEKAEAKRLEQAHERLREELRSAQTTARKNDERASQIAGSLRSERDSAREEAEALRARVIALEEDLERAVEWAERQESELEETRGRMTDRRLHVIEDLLGEGDRSVEDLADGLRTAADLLSRIEAERTEARDANEAREAAEERARRAYTEHEEAVAAAAEHEASAAEEIDAAWQQRDLHEAREQVEFWERELLKNGTPGHLFIDGHNLILRRFGKAKERTSRQWLEQRVVEMADRFGVRTHLVFDTKYPSNDYPLSPHVRCYFANKHDEGGADGMIGDLVREHANGGHMMVCSSDRRHVWADTIRACDEEGIDVEPVDADLLHHYLMAVEDLAAVEGR